jgi:imidazole glycerol phosphate synthase glutamine amidotransferase subunit
MTDRSATSGAPSLRAGIVDHGAGNLVSITQGLAVVGAEVLLVRRPADLDGVDLLVLPGVGAAAPAMATLHRAELVEPIRDWIAADRPFLGICLGLQLLFDGSDEDGAECLGVIPGRTERLIGAPTLPHIGWNQVERLVDHPVFDGIAAAADFYFVHSYAGRPTAAAEDVVLAETSHGSRFVSAIARRNLIGVQFHPERSGDDGLRLLANAVAMATAVAHRPTFALDRVS